MDLETVSGWIEAAYPVLGKADAYPLIDDGDALGENWTGDDVVDLWMRWYDPAVVDRVREVFDEVLKAHRGELAARFVALSFFFQLAHNNVPEKEEEVADFRAACRRHLKELVQLADTSEFADDPKRIRWEIVNACAAEQWERADELHDRLVRLAPTAESYETKGQFLFQVLFMKKELDDDDSLEKWRPVVPPLKPGDDLLLWTCGWLRYGLGVAENQSGELEAAAKARLHDAIASLRTAIDLDPNLHPSYRSMLAYCLRSAGSFADAATEYLRLLREPWMPFGTKLHEHFAEKLHHNAASAFEQAGRIPDAIQMLTELLERVPEAKGVYMRLADFERKQGNHDRAFELLRRQCDLDPSFDTGAVSLALAFGELHGDNWQATLDQLNKEFSPSARQAIQAVLSEYWPRFNELRETSRDHWTVGLGLLHGSDDLQKSYGVVALASVVEGELRIRLFERYKRQAKRQDWQELPNDRSPFRDFRAYLEGGKQPGLGVMFWCLQSLDDPALTKYSDWLQANYPGFIDRVRALETRKITAIRDRVHKLWQRVSPADVKAAATCCRELLELLLETERRSRAL
jgi:tetratricopeptide (TPR) repeat protein